MAESVRPVAGRRQASQKRSTAARPTIVADIVLTGAAACLSMAATVSIQAVFDDDILLGDVGRQVLLTFAVTLIAGSVMLALLGLVLLRDARRTGESYYAPIAIGLVIGAIEAVLLLELVGRLMWFPPVLAILALRPVRRLVFAPLYRGANDGRRRP